MFMSILTQSREGEREIESEWEGEFERLSIGKRAKNKEVLIRSLYP